MSEPIIQEPIWFNSWRLRREVPPHLQDWLGDADSMTKKLRFAADKFELRVHRESWQVPSPSEVSRLLLPNRNLAFIREVALWCNNQPWLFARTIMPMSILRGRHKRLCHLGTKPLGEVIFRDRTLSRSSFEVAKLNPEHYLYQKAMMNYENYLLSLWARRSIFYISNKPLLVSEVFTPWFMHYLSLNS